MARYSEKQKAALDALMKDDVHDHAMEIIRNDGIDGLTMERLATVVGVSRGTLYNYFDDKNAVIDYVEERNFGGLIEAVEEIAAGDLPPDQKLADVARWIFTAVYEDSALFIALKPIKHMRATRECHIERREKAMQAIEGIVREGISNGSFRKLSPVVVSEIFLGALVGMLEGMMATGEFYRADAVVPTLMDLYLDGLHATD